MRGKNVQMKELKKQKVFKGPSIEQSTENSRKTKRFEVAEEIEKVTTSKSKRKNGIQYPPEDPKFKENSEKLCC